MTRCLVVLVIVGLTGLGNLTQAGVIFSDDFSGSTLDTSKWTAVVDWAAGCSLEVSGGILRNYFKGIGTGGRGYSYARSISIELPSDWDFVTITGQWAYPTAITGELLMKVWDAANESGSWSVVAYSTYGGEKFRSQDPAGTNYISRSRPTFLTDFEWTITPDGWSFKEYRGGNWEILVNRSTTIFASMNNLVLQIGGWEFSSTSLQEVNYDNITIIPEPATICLLTIGSLVFVRRRK